MDTLKRIEKIIRESAFDEKKVNPGLKFNPGLALTGVRTTGPRVFPLGMSDHDSIYATLWLKNKRPPPKFIKTRNYNRMDIEKFQLLIKKSFRTTLN